jgi:hypothetical protein
LQFSSWHRVRMMLAHVSGSVPSGSEDASRGWAEIPVIAFEVSVTQG